MNKVGDQSVSPYLLQRLRSLDEVQDEREQRQREFGTKPAPQTPPVPPETPKIETPKTEPSTEAPAPEAPPGRRLDQSV